MFKTLMASLLVLVFSACTATKPKTIYEPVKTGRYPDTRNQDVRPRPIYRKTTPEYSGQREQYGHRDRIEVRPGDTVYSISRSYGVHPADVISINNLEYPYTIYPGQMLILPNVHGGGQTSPYAEKDQDKIKIEKIEGSTTNPPVRIHQSASKTEPSGQPVALSEQTTKIEKDHYYVVQKGDTLYSIARNKGYDVKELIRLNKLEEPYTISPGAVLTLPK